jgi:hypothetical protein
MAKTRGALGGLDIFVPSLKKAETQSSQTERLDFATGVGLAPWGKASGVSREKHQIAPFQMQTFCGNSAKAQATL